MEGIGNSSIAPIATTLSNTAVESGNSETTYSAPAVSPAKSGCAVERMEEECATPKLCKQPLGACGQFISCF